MNTSRHRPHVRPDGEVNLYMAARLDLAAATVRKSGDGKPKLKPGASTKKP